MQIAQEIITPEVARAYLEMNAVNRVLNPQTVENYSRDMVAGRWCVNGDVIRFREGGALADGQHRLHAVISTGIPLKAIVVRGLTMDDMLTVDTGRKRSSGDNFSIRGESNGNALGAAIRSLACFAEMAHRVALTNSESVAILDRHPEIRASVQALRPARIVTPSYVMALHYIGSRTGFADRADAMANVILNGVPDYDGCAMHALREHILRTRLQRVKLDAMLNLRLHAKAWNLFIAQTPVKILKEEGVNCVIGWSSEKLYSAP